MVQRLLPLRLLLLLPALGALIGAAIMFWLAGVKLKHGAEVLWTDSVGAAGEIMASVMGATDALLFGVVLIVFAFAIAFGFALQLDDQASERLPAWMRIHAIRDLKHSLVEVILVYLVVDFATDIAAAGGELVAWQLLVKPVSIVLISVASHFMGAHK